MSDLKIMRTTEGNGLSFWCPGCKEAHRVITPAWTFNGNFDKPTLSPSILVTGSSRFPTDAECDQAIATGQPVDLPPKRCHSYVTDGQIQFLGDCLHPLAGQTVPLEPF